MESDVRWLCVLFAVEVVNRIPLYASMTLLGPTQPYLAHRFGVEIDEINSIWTICECVYE